MAENVMKEGRNDLCGVINGFCGLLFVPIGVNLG
jgi:hypothetical protein